MLKKLLFLLLLAAPALGTTRYVAQTPGLFVGGTNCNGHIAIDASAFNATAQSPDDINWVCGGIVGAANSNILIVNGSGTSGHNILINFDSGSSLQSPVCAADGGGTGDGGCLSLYNRSFITVDGRNIGSASLSSLSGGGFIQNTDNGDAKGHHCGAPHSGDTDCLTTLIDAFAAHDITIENLILDNAYVKVLNDTSAGVGGDQQHAITFSGSHVIFTNNQIDDCGWCLFYNYLNNQTDANIYLNEFSHFGHAIMYATANSGASSINPALRLYSNVIQSPNNWTTPACGFHNDGLHAFGVLGDSSMDGLFISNNWFKGTWGHCATGFIYIEKGSSQPSNAKTIAIWNNVGDATTETTWQNSNGWFGVFEGDSGTQKIYNNTLIGNASTTNTLALGQQALSALSSENNVLSGFENPIQIRSSSLSVVDNNFYGGTQVCANGNNCYDYNGVFQGSLAAWRTACSCDPNAVANTNPLLNSDGSPQGNSPVLGIGVNLTSQATGELASLQFDTTLGGTRTPLRRPSVGKWDAGAFTLSQSGPSAPIGFIFALKINWAPRPTSGK